MTWQRETISEIAALALTLAARGLSRAAPSREEMSAFVAATVEQTAQNFSSMHQDVALGRLTEIDQLNGWSAAAAAGSYTLTAD